MHTDELLEARTVETVHLKIHRLNHVGTSLYSQSRPNT